MNLAPACGLSSIHFRNTIFLLTKQKYKKKTVPLSELHEGQLHHDSPLCWYHIQNQVAQSLCPAMLSAVRLG